MQLILWLKNYPVHLQLYIDMLGRLRKNRKESKKMKKVCLFLLMLVFSISASSKDFKYHLKTKDELKELIKMKLSILVI